MAAISACPDGRRRDLRSARGPGQHHRPGRRLGKFPTDQQPTGDGGDGGFAYVSNVLLIGHAQEQDAGAVQRLRLVVE